MLPCLLTHLGDICVSNDTIPVIDRLFNLLEVIANSLSQPLVAVPNKPAALHQPLRPLAAAGIVGSKGSFEVLVRLHPLVLQQCSQHGGILNAESGSSAVVRGCRVRSVTRDTDAAFVEGRDGVVA